MCQDSSDYAGYEEAIDDYAAQAAGAASKGTKRVSHLCMSQRASLMDIQEAVCKHFLLTHTFLDLSLQVESLSQETEIIRQ